MKTIKYEELVKSKWCTSPPSKNIESTYLVSSLKSNLTIQILINGIFALYFNLEKKNNKKIRITSLCNVYCLCESQCFAWVSQKKIAWCRFINITDEKLVHFQGLTGTEWALHFLNTEFHLSRTYEGEALMNKWVSMTRKCNSIDK